MLPYLTLYISIAMVKMKRLKTKLPPTKRQRNKFKKGKFLDFRLDLCRGIQNFLFSLGFTSIYSLPHNNKNSFDCV